MTRTTGVSREFKNIADRWLAQLESGGPGESPFAASDSESQVFSELSGVSPKNRDIPFSPSLTFSGVNNNFTNNSLSAVAKIFPQFNLEGDFPDSLPLVVDFFLRTTPGGGDEVEFDIFIAGLAIGDIMGTGGEVAGTELFAVGALVQDELARFVFEIPTAIIPDNSGLISIGVLRDATAGNPADTFNGDVVLVQFTLLIPHTSTASISS